jgi:hypothetical protein
MTRNEAYRRFGPKLLEAIVRKLVDEINILRLEAGLAQRTQAQVLDALVAEYQSLPDYDWMEE